MLLWRERVCWGRGGRGGKTGSPDLTNYRPPATNPVSFRMYFNYISRHGLPLVRCSAVCFRWLSLPHQRSITKSNKCSYIVTHLPGAHNKPEGLHVGYLCRAIKCRELSFLEHCSLVTPRVCVRALHLAPLATAHDCVARWVKRVWWPVSLHGGHLCAVRQGPPGGREHGAAWNGSR